MRKGREVAFEKGELIFKARFYLVGKRLFQTSIGVRKCQNSPARLVKFYETLIAKFLDSFKPLISPVPDPRTAANVLITLNFELSRCV